MVTSSNGNIGRVNSPHKGPVTRSFALMFSMSCAWTNGWANDEDTGDLRRHCAYYDITVMIQTITTKQLPREKIASRRTNL